VFASADGPMHLDGETISNLYRIAQESVQNAIKHGQATHIRIALDCKNADCLLTITDNGSGIDNKTCSKGEGNGMGLTIMKHRAALIGGQVAVVSHNGGGTVVNCIFKNEKKNPEQNHETPHPAGR
jgi:signal transduction histidine kinase